MPTIHFQGFRTYPQSREVWRYIDLPSLLWILENEKIHFSSPVDDFDDRYETTLPKAWYEFQEDQWRAIAEAFDHDVEEMWERQSRKREEMRNSIYASCWHLNQNESAGMWELYGEADYTLAIKTTIQNLIDCFNKQEQYGVAVGEVQYVDFDSDWASISEEEMENIRYVHSNNDDTVGLTLLKREEFQHEQELRCVVLDEAVPRQLSEYYEYNAQDEVEEPLYVPVDVNDLIKEIRLPPGARDWFIEAVIDAVENNRNTKFSRENIRKSQLDTERHL